MNAVTCGAESAPSWRWCGACAVPLAAAAGVQLLWPQAPSLAQALFAVAMAPATPSRVPATVIRVTAAAAVLPVATRRGAAYAVAELPFAELTVQTLLAAALGLLDARDDVPRC